MSWPYRDCNKESVTARKGKLARAPLVYSTREEASALAESVRRRGFNARLYDRSINADGLTVFVWVVVVREKGAK